MVLPENSRNDVNRDPLSMQAIKKIKPELILDEKNTLRFYQVDKSRKGGTGRGIGLGLPIAKQIVLAHNGQIQAHSNSGQGTTFIVDLPFSNSQDQTLSIKKAH